MISVAFLNGQSYEQISCLLAKIIYLLIINY